MPRNGACPGRRRRAVDAQGDVGPVRLPCPRLDHDGDGPADAAERRTNLKRPQALLISGVVGQRADLTEPPRLDNLGIFPRSQEQLFGLVPGERVGSLVKIRFRDLSRLRLGAVLELGDEVAHSPVAGCLAQLPEGI